MCASVSIAAVNVLLHTRFGASRGWCGHSQAFDLSLMGQIQVLGLGHAALHLSQGAMQLIQSEQHQAALLAVRRPCDLTKLFVNVQVIGVRDDTGEDPMCHNSECFLGFCTSIADHLLYMGEIMGRGYPEC